MEDRPPRDRGAATQSHGTAPQGSTSRPPRFDDDLAWRGSYSIVRDNATLFTRATRWTSLTQWRPQHNRAMQRRGDIAIAARTHGGTCWPVGAAQKKPPLVWAWSHCLESREIFLSLMNRELLARFEETAAARSARPGNPLEGHLRYEMVRELGSGAQGCVYLALDKHTDDHVAVKCIPRGTQMNDKVERELLNHRKFWHAHVIQFYEVFLTDKDVCIVMEYAPGGSLRDFLKSHSLTEDGARLYFQQLIFAVNYCHHMGVANRDIKLDNTLLSDNQRLLKLCDFGLSKDETSQCRTQVGTPNYLPPEIIQMPRGGTYDGKQSDVWCCGVMLYTMLCGSFPFERREDKDLPVNQILENLMERIVNVDWQVPDHIHLSAECLDLLKKILNPDPKERITIKGIQMHPWYNTGLPPGAAQSDFPKRPEDDGLQSIASIVQIVQQAKMMEGCE